MADSIETTIKRVQHECDKMRALDIGSVQLPITRVEALLEHVAKLEAADALIRQHMEAGANPPFDDPVKNADWLIHYHNEALNAVQYQSARVIALEAHNATLKADLDAARDRVATLLDGRRG